MSQRRKSWQPVAVAAGAAIFVALLGGLMTDLGPWYLGLRQPSFKPPDALFGPAWTLIFALCAIAGVLGWRRAPDRAARENLLMLFALNGFLNVLWSLLYFRLHRPDWAAIEVVALWLSIVALMWALRRYAPKAHHLLWPYLIWVSFAAVLNFETVRLNGPFGAG